MYQNIENTYVRYHVRSAVLSANVIECKIVINVIQDNQHKLKKDGVKVDWPELAVLTGVSLVLPATLERHTTDSGNWCESGQGLSRGPCL